MVAMVAMRTSRQARSFSAVLVATVAMPGRLVLPTAVLAVLALP
jgi:hypothetical protein